MRFSHIFKYRKKIEEKGSSKLYLKLRSYFMLTLALVVLLPFGAFGLLSYTNFKSDMQESIANIADENINQVSSTLGYILRDMTTYCNIILNNIESSEHFKQKISKSLETSSIPSPTDLNSLREQLDKVLSVSQNKHIPIVNIYIIYKDKPYTIYSTQSGNVILDSSTLETLSNSTRNSPEMLKLLGTNMRFYGDGSYIYVTSFVKPFKSTGNSGGFFLIDIDNKSIESTVNTIRTNKFPGSEVYLIDNENNIMYSSNPALLTTEIDDSLSKNSMETSSEFFTGIIDDQQVHISSRTIPDHNWKVISVVPLNESNKYTFFMKNYLVILVILCIIVIFAFSFIIKLLVLNPINELSTAVSSYNHSSYRPKIGYDKEVDDKPNSDASSVNDIQGLIHRVYSTKLEQKETQLKSLQSQINPHFLYNTLESIRGAALYNGIPSIAEMSRCLSSLFRYSISNDLLVPIKSEIQNIEEYIAIQNFRHDDKFDLTYNISEKLYDYKILKLTLQPIIENSIKHGLEMKLGKGRIKLSILSLDNTIRIEISDDGLGIPSEKIRELNKQLVEGAYSEQNIMNQAKNGGNITTSSGTGIGVQNVNSRIKLYFGDQYGVKYHECQVGATVEIILPIITEQTSN